jgi:hypothetical protein
MRGMLAGSSSKDSPMQRDRQKKSWREVDRSRDSSAHRRDNQERDRRRDETARANAEAREHRNALEALFAPKKEEDKVAAPTPKTAARIVLAPNPDADPRNAERRKLLDKVLTATGPAAISKASNEFIAAGFTYPDDQEVYLQLLEHVDEACVRDAIERLTALCAGQLPKRKPLLDQRLRRIEAHADEQATRDAAAALRRVIAGRPQATPPGGA